MLALALGAVRADAQPANVIPARWTAGYTLGFNSSQFNGTLADSIPKSQIGFSLGAFFNVPLKGLLAIQTELLIATRGGAFDEPIYGYYIEDDTTIVDLGQVGTTRRVVDLMYLELPVLAIVSLPTRSKYVPHLQGGISPALRLTGKFRGGGDTGDEAVDPDNANRFLSSWVGGAGLNIYGKRGVFSIDVRYQSGMQDIFKPEYGPPGSAEAWTLVIGIRPNAGAD